MAKAEDKPQDKVAASSPPSDDGSITTEKPRDNEANESDIGPDLQHEDGAPTNDTDAASTHSINDDLTDLTKDLESVSIAPRLSVETLLAPTPIKRVAALLSAQKYSNIVILTGAGISCNAG
jgi:hypothetical protein